jgi:hypothetical protein
VHNLLSKVLENPGDTDEHLQLCCQDWTTTDHAIANMGADAILYRGVQLAAKRCHDMMVQQNKTGKSPLFDDDHAPVRQGMLGRLGGVNSALCHAAGLPGYGDKKQVVAIGNVVKAVVFPANNDVLCSPGKPYFSHEGNSKFREVVCVHVDAYHNAHSQEEKLQIIGHVTDKVLGKGASFLWRINLGWYDGGIDKARKKVCF